MSEIVGTFRSLIDRGVAGATHEGATTFGPIPLRLRADVPDDLHEVAAHLASGAHQNWRPLDVITVTGATIPSRDVPIELRPTGEEIARSVGDELIVFAAAHEGCTWFLDRARSLAMRWVPHVNDIPLWENINPLRCAARWWAVEHGAAMVHCGAVADADGAVLLIGDAGAGKSTSSLACIGTDLDVLGDDFCFVQSAADRAVVHPMYKLAKLDDRAIDLLPHLRERIVGTGMRGKSLVRLDERPLESRRVRAICHVVQATEGDTRVDPIPRSEAIRAVAPSTVEQIRLLEMETFQNLVSAVLRARSYRLSVNDVRDVPSVLCELLERP